MVYGDFYSRYPCEGCGERVHYHAFGCSCGCPPEPELKPCAGCYKRFDPNDLIPTDNGEFCYSCMVEDHLLCAADEEQLVLLSQAQARAA